jgi:hypothetical protein
MSLFYSQGSPSSGGAHVIGSGRGDGPGPELMAASTLKGTMMVRRTEGMSARFPTSCSMSAVAAVAYGVLSEGLIMSALPVALQQCRD